MTSVTHISNLVAAQKADTVNRVCGLDCAGDRIAVASLDRSIHIFDSAGIRRDKFTAKPQDKENPDFCITGLAFDATGQRLAVAQSDCIVYVYNLGASHGDKKTICNKFPTDTWPVTGISWTNGGNSLLIVSLEGKLRVGNLRSNKTSLVECNAGGVVTAVASPSGDLAAVLLTDGSITVVPIVPQTTLSAAKLPRINGAELMAWSSGNCLAVGSGEGRVHLLHATEGKELGQFPISSRVGALAFNPTGDVLAVGCAEGVGILVKSGNSAWQSGGFPIKLTGYFGVTSLAWNDDGSRLALGGVSGGAELFEFSLARKSRKQGNTEIVFRTATDFQVRDASGKGVGNFRSAEPLLDAQIVKEQYILGHSDSTLFLGDLVSGNVSEIVWQFSAQDKFSFEYENVVLGFREGELFVFELGRSEICGSVRTEFPFAEVVSCRVVDEGERICVGYLIDGRSAGVFECVSGTLVSTVTVQDAEIDWLELDVSGNRLLFRDKRKQLHIFDGRTGARSQLLHNCGFCQWVPSSEVFVAQSGERLSVWYSIDALDKVTVKEINFRSTVVEIERTDGRTVVVVEDERGSQTEYELDENLINFHTFLDSKNYTQAAQALEQLPLTQETQTLWNRLGLAALSDPSLSHLALGEKCFAEISDYAKARFVKSLRKEKDAAVVRAKLMICLHEDLRGAEMHLVGATAKLEVLLDLYRKLHKWEDAIRVATAASQSGGLGNQQLEKSIKLEYLAFLITTGQEDMAAELQEREGNYIKALELFLKGGFLLRAYSLVQKRTVFSPEVLLRVAGALENGGFFKEAGELFRRANRPEAAVECLIKGGDFRSAVDLVTTMSSTMSATERETTKRKLEAAWAEDLLKSRRFEKAIERFVAGGNFEKAIEAAVSGRMFEKVDPLLDRAKSERSAADFVTLCLSAGDRLKTARKWREAEIAFLRSGSRAEKLVLVMFLEAGEFADAARVYRKFSGTSDELRGVVSARARELETSGKWQEAEAAYLVASELVDDAISMRNRQGDFDSVLRLVRANKTPEVFAETCKAIGTFFEKRKELGPAENYFCQGGHWLQAISMYRSVQRWDDAKRVGSAHGGRAALEKVCYAQAANEGSVEEGVRVLVAQNMPDIAVAFAADRRQFDLAFDLVRKFPEKISDKLLKELLHKRGVVLEEQGNYGGAEADFVKAGRPKLAVDMYMHLRDWSSALRVASESGDTELAKAVVLAQVNDAIDMRYFENALEIYQRFGGSPEAFVNLLLEKKLPEEAFKVCRKFNLNAKLTNDVASKLSTRPATSAGTGAVGRPSSSLGRPATPRVAGGAAADSAAIEYHFRGERYEEGLALAEKQGVLNQYLAEYFRLGQADAVTAARFAKVLPKFPIKKPTDRTLEENCKNFFRTLLLASNADRGLALQNFRAFAKASSLNELSSAASLAANFAHAKQQGAAPELVAKIALSLLRFPSLVPVDMALFEAGLAFQAAGKVTAAFFFLNRYLDISDAVDSGMAVDLEAFGILNIGNLSAPSQLYGDVETAKELVLGWSVDPSLHEAPTLRACDKCGSQIFSHSTTCPRCGDAASDTCVVTGAPLVKSTAKVSCAHCGVVAMRENWTEFMSKMRACPSCGNSS